MQKRYLKNSKTQVLWGKKKKKSSEKRKELFSLTIDVFVSYGCYNKLTINLWLKMRNVFSQCWRPEVRNQGVEASLPLSGSRCESHLSPLPAFGSCWHSLASLASGHITPVCASIFTLPFPQ